MFGSKFVVLLLALVIPTHLPSRKQTNQLKRSAGEVPITRLVVFN